MGIFDFFKKGTPTKFITENQFSKLMGRQATNTHQIMAQLRELGVTDDKELSLEYFFYTNTLEKAAKLANGIKTLHYSSEYGASQGGKGIFIITGWSTHILMSEENVTTWATQMCQLGYDFDCEFDGWGTHPEQ